MKATKKAKANGPQLVPVTSSVVPLVQDELAGATVTLLVEMTTVAWASVSAEQPMATGMVTVVEVETD